MEGEEAGQGRGEYLPYLKVINYLRYLKVPA